MVKALVDYETQLTRDGPPNWQLDLDYYDAKFSETTPEEKKIIHEKV
jgi:hypothetical protein